MSKIGLALSKMIYLANNDVHGYDQAYRWGERGDYDCSSAVITALEEAGIPAKTNGATYTGNMKRVLIALGFKDVTSSCHLSTGNGLVVGDILLNEKHHVAMYAGNGMEVEASINEKGGVTGGEPGDQTGREFLVRSYRNYPWDCVLRYEEYGLGSPCFVKRENTLDIGFNFNMPNNEGRFKWLLYDIAKGTWETLVEWTDSNWISLKKNKSHAGYLVQCQLYDCDMKQANHIDTKTIGCDCGTLTVINGTYANWIDGNILLGCTSNNKDAIITMKVYSVEEETWFTQFTGNWATLKPTRGNHYIVQFEATDKDGQLLDYKAIGV